MMQERLTPLLGNRSLGRAAGSVGGLAECRATPTALAGTICTDDRRQ